MQLFKFFILATIVSFIGVLAAPIDIEGTQDLVAREPGVKEWFQNLGKNVKNFFKKLGKKMRGKKSKKAKKAEPKKETTEPAQSPSSSVEARELGVVFAREDADDLFEREYEEVEYDAREFDDELFEARELDDELYAREPESHADVYTRELYDVLD